MKAAASFATFSDITGSMALPLPSTGCAAPLFVPGAIAATSADSRMKNPADAARAPPGATYTTTGTFDPVIFATISRVESSNPPGVEISINTAFAFVCAA